MALPVIASVIVKGATRGGVAAFLARRILGRSDVQIEGGIGITLRGNVTGAGRNLEKLMREHDGITALALNKAARSARTATGRELARVKGVPQKMLRRRIRSYNASARKKPIRASLWIGTKKPITANELGGRLGASRAGHVKVGKRTFRGAFPATMPGGHRGIFMRKPHAKHRPRPDGQWTQLPIEEAIVQLMPEAEDISRRAASKAITEIYPKEVRRLMNLRADRWRF